MLELLVGMLEQFRLDLAAHRALHDAGSDPVLVIGQPFLGQRLVQHFGQFLYVEVQNLRSLLFHRLAFLVGNVCVDYCKDCAKQQKRHRYGTDGASVGFRLFRLVSESESRVLYDPGGS